MLYNGLMLALAWCGQTCIAARKDTPTYGVTVSYACLVFYAIGHAFKLPHSLPAMFTYNTW